jgi:hypothetical protein
MFLRVALQNGAKLLRSGEPIHPALADVTARSMEEAADVFGQMMWAEISKKDCRHERPSRGSGSADGAGPEIGKEEE